MDHVVIVKGMNMAAGDGANVSCGYDYSHIHIKGYKDTLVITDDVLREYSQYQMYPIPDKDRLLLLMNIALRYRQYINFEEV